MLLDESHEGRRPTSRKVLQPDTLHANCHDTFANFSPPLAFLSFFLFFFFYIELNESEGKEAAHLPVANSKINYLICRLNRLSSQFTLKALNIVPFLTWDRWRIEILFMILSLRLNNMKSAKYQGKL